MLSLKAEYENGKLTCDVPLPQGKKQVIITFLEDENDQELHPEWEAEIQSRIESIENGTAVLHDGQDVIDEIKKELAG